MRVPILAAGSLPAQIIRIPALERIPGFCCVIRLSGRGGSTADRESSASERPGPAPRRGLRPSRWTSIAAGSPPSRCAATWPPTPATGSAGCRRPGTGAWRQLLREGGALRVSELAAGTGWSGRHLTSRFRAEIGLTPKAAARVIRFDRARRRLIGYLADPQYRLADL